MTRRRVRALVAGLALLVTALVVTVGVHSTRWVGTTFPGFFVMVNRVVPSIELPGWAAAEPSRLFQHQVIAVDGMPVARAEDVYAAVARHPEGRAIRYALRSPHGERFEATVPSRRFTVGDWFLLFGSFLATGASFLAASLLVFFLKPEAPAARGLLGAGLTIGLFATTAADLYGPFWFVRLHVVGESLVTAGFIHLALVFPTERLRRWRRTVLLGVYGLFGALALAYELVLDSPGHYTTAHLVASAAHSVAAVSMIVSVVWAWVATRSPLVRRRIGVVVLPTFLAFLVPALIMGASGLLGGRVPVNAAALTAPIFPLSLGYAIAKKDLFEIDVMLRRAATYAIVLAAMACVYLLVLLAAQAFVPVRLLVDSPVLLAVLNLALLFLIAPLRTRVQDHVDRLFFRRGYDAEEALSELGHGLASASTLPAVAQRTERLLGHTLCPETAAILPCEGGLIVGGQTGPVTLPEDLARRLSAGEILARYEWDDGSERPLPPIWPSLGAEVIVPVRSEGLLVAVLALGMKGSGRPYTIHDITFLRAAATQVALGFANARSFSQLEALNASLERQVAERTAALATANEELSRSIAEVRDAYERLERSQASLVRADRLAMLGRLAAGIAHEVNTPLGAVLNQLRVAHDLSREYADSIDDPGVQPNDHREIARELLATVEATTAWARKAAAYISKMKAHGRDPGPVRAEPVRLRAVVTEAEALLGHRLRAATCRLECTETPAGVTVTGDPTRLGQVLVNLIANALDAYEDRGAAEGRIAVDVTASAGSACIAVRDWAGGMPPEVAAHVFDELFTTKEPGRGTGLGLWIARTIVEQSFGGTLTLETVAGEGSCFTITVPLATSAAHAA